MQYKTLKTLRLKKIGQYTPQKNIPVIDMQSPVSDIMTEFCDLPPQVVDKHVSIDDVFSQMQKNQAKYALVKDKQQGIVGLISYADLCSRKVLITCERKGLSRAELNAEDMMIPRELLHGIRYHELDAATVGDLIHTMQQLGEAYALIVDEEENLCGVISSRAILRALKIPLDIPVTAHSFRDIFHVIHKHAELA